MHHPVITPRQNGAEPDRAHPRSEEHTSELQSLTNLVCRLLLEKKNVSDNVSIGRCNTAGGDATSGTNGCGGCARGGRGPTGPTARHRAESARRVTAPSERGHGR